jgi:hypothetical protein
VGVKVAKAVILRVTEHDRTMAGQIITNYHNHGWQADDYRLEDPTIDESTICYRLQSPQGKIYDVKLQKFKGSFFHASWVIICDLQTDDGGRISRYSGVQGLSN